ncbi:aminotransferase class V-fold PLP-dependent enzyme [Anaerotignum lactatifermentans]|uniref:Aminotransferase class V-fold PLP-dependent enzyme n=1 Tax=Anaerotignum lactatifermentans TaxID=160404 RepID=A0ABS2G923_9FIRM|nr:aminotransferase class I/II-fold pyridoxal phosphate-dependent enzyme [Anaerotignum lactatifermentans]MBM6828572.1 aminotransferase class V-fold PLP-dependent enzyme [Anaerotignum lactatifermentans]MBM6877979.1 aminotransferase class V-fold PLP-dependent enzyme [Anaerotignum lactatifermentans]MBM6950154.1 aminotransferase class V-fold PLP-dependent enzyme [Anaerotignum lactatifermentans]
MTLFQKLKEYSGSGFYSFHMPGHKRQTSFPSPLPLELDITEISGFDNLHEAEGILKDAMEGAAAFFGADRSFFLVNGSSGGILAAIRACTKRGDTILMARGCHKAVYHGVELCGLKTVYLQAELIPEWGIFGSISPTTVAETMDAHPECRVVLLTSPTYEGVLSDIASIAEEVHRREGILIVDEAHGAHLGMGEFPPSAIQCGADIVIQSLHKTLPSPTQTAIMHIRCGRIVEQEVQRQLAVFQTSSPSYLFLGAMEACVEYLKKHKNHILPKYTALLREFYARTSQLKHLRIFYPMEEVYAHDRGKILIGTQETNLTGPELARMLREKFLLETEMSTVNTVLAMTSLCDSEEGLRRLADALRSIDAGLKKQNLTAPEEMTLPNAVCTIEQAVQSEKEAVFAENAIGRISADYFWAYPPGIPLLVPGEEITAEILEKMKIMRRNGVEIHSAYSLEERIFVLTLDTEFSAMV